MSQTLILVGQPIKSDHMCNIVIGKKILQLDACSFVANRLLSQGNRVWLNPRKFNWNGLTTNLEGSSNKLYGTFDIVGVNMCLYCEICIVRLDLRGEKLNQHAESLAKEGNCYILLGLVFCDLKYNQ